MAENDNKDGLPAAGPRRWTQLMAAMVDAKCETVVTHAGYNKTHSDVTSGHLHVNWHLRILLGRSDICCAICSARTVPLTVHVQSCIRQRESKESKSSHLWCQDALTFNLLGAPT
jgi:hypothetical protein